MQLEHAIRTRRTHKAFAPDPLDAATLDELFELARWAPNHHLTNPWRFRVLGPRSRERLMELAEAAEAGGLRLAPLYDLLSTRLYPLDDKLAMYVDSVQKADRVTAERIVNEATKWGITPRIAEEVVAGTLDRLPAAIKQATEETGALPDSLPELVNKRVDQLLSTTLPSDRA
jgi:nitroreductase